MTLHYKVHQLQHDVALWTEDHKTTLANAISKLNAIMTHYSSSFVRLSTRRYFHFWINDYPPPLLRPPHSVHRNINFPRTISKFNVEMTRSSSFVLHSTRRCISLHFLCLLLPPSKNLIFSNNCSPKDAGLFDGGKFKEMVQKELVQIMEQYPIFFHLSPFSFIIFLS
jgi:hypothetical protein